MNEKTIKISIRDEDGMNYIRQLIMEENIGEKSIEDMIKIIERNAGKGIRVTEAPHCIGALYVWNYEFVETGGKRKRRIINCVLSGFY